MKAPKHILLRQGFIILDEVGLDTQCTELFLLVRFVKITPCIGKNLRMDYY